MLRRRHLREPVSLPFGLNLQERDECADLFLHRLESDQGVELAWTSASVRAGSGRRNWSEIQSLGSAPRSSGIDARRAPASRGPRPRVDFEPRLKCAPQEGITLRSADDRAD